MPRGNYKGVHKDVLKALLDQGTHSPLFFFREYWYGKQGNVLGQKWFSQLAQRELISLTSVHKLSVVPLPWFFPSHRITYHSISRFGCSNSQKNSLELA